MSDMIKIQIYKCSECHHEWEFCSLLENPKTCDWCGAKGNIIDTKEYDMSFIKKALDKLK